MNSIKLDQIVVYLYLFSKLFPNLFRSVWGTNDDSNVIPLVDFRTEPIHENYLNNFESLRINKIQYSLAPGKSQHRFKLVLRV